MKKLLLIASMCFAMSTSTFAGIAFSVELNIGVMGYAGGCFTGAGICTEEPSTPMSMNGTLVYENATGEMWYEIETTSSIYSALDGGSFEFADKSYLPVNISSGFGFGNSRIYIDAGNYAVETEDGSGKRILPVSFTVETEE